MADILNQSSNAIYGMYADGSATYSSDSLITIANPAPGTYRLRIADPSDPQPAAGSYTLSACARWKLDVSTYPPPKTPTDSATRPPAFSPTTNEPFSRSRSPSDLNGTPILGWYPTLSTVSGSAQFRLYKDH